MKFERMYGSSNVSLTYSNTEVRDECHIDKSSLTFHSNRVIGGLPDFKFLQCRVSVFLKLREVQYGVEQKDACTSPTYD